MASSTPSESPQDPASAAGPPTVGDVELTNLQRLRASGALTEGEYARAVDAITRAQAEGDPAVTAPSPSAPSVSGPALGQADVPQADAPAATSEPSEYVPGGSASSEYVPGGTASTEAPADSASAAAAAAPSDGPAAPAGDASASGQGAPATEFVRTAEVAELVKLAKNWWIFLVTGLLWVIVALILLQFSTRSIATVGYIAGALLIVAGAEYLYVGFTTHKMKWVWFIFGTLFVLGGLWAFLNPGKTAATLALSLGLLFVLIGVLWIIEAMMQRTEYSLWWLGLISGIVMVALGVWAANQTTAAKMATLLWVAFMWALITGITDIFRAFYVRRFGKMMSSVRA